MYFVEFGVNFIVAALLIVTIGYCWTLNKRIRILQDSRSELADLLMHFDLSTQKANESIGALQVASKKIGETIQSRIEKANYISDDLHFLVERAEKLADKMELSVTQAQRMQAAPVAAPMPPAPVIREEVFEPDMEQARLAIQKARAAVEEEEKSAKAPATAPTPKQASRNITLSRRSDEQEEPGNNSLQQMLEKLAARQVSDPALRTGARQSTPSRSRSRAEQELLEIIKAGSKA